MRLRYLLPAVETAVSVVFVLIPLWWYLPYYRLVGQDGLEIVCHDNCPYPNFYGVDSVAFATAVNLPAAIAVLPILSAKWDYTHDRHDYFHDPVWRSLGFVVAGIMVWFLFGRLLDDVITWRHSRASPGFRIGNLVFAMSAAATATLAAITSGTAGEPLRLWYLVWIPVWVFVGYLGVTVEMIWLVGASKVHISPTNGRPISTRK